MHVTMALAAGRLSVMLKLINFQSIKQANIFHCETLVSWNPRSAEPGDPAYGCQIFGASSSSATRNNYSPPF